MVGVVDALLVLESNPTNTNNIEPFIPRSYHAKKVSLKFNMWCSNCDKSGKTFPYLWKFTMFHLNPHDD